MDLLLKPWPWYISGPLIGFTVPILYFLVGKPFGISASYSSICTISLGKFFPQLREHIVETWNLCFVLGIFLGGYIASGILSLEPIQFLPSSYEQTTGLLTLFGGGLLVGFGTRYAGGCTSGHSITGLSNLQSTSLIATLSFFFGGLIATHLLVFFS